MTPLAPHAWSTVWCLWIVAFLNYLDRMMLSAMREPIKASIPMSDAQFGLLTALFLWIYALVSPLGGFLADRFGKRRVILASLLMWSAVTCGTALAQSFEALLVSRALMGISEACYIPAALALVSDFHRGTTRSLATGIHMSGIYAGSALGGAGGWAAESWGWRTAFLVFGAAGILYAGVLWRRLQDAPPSATQNQKTAAPPLLRLQAWRLIGPLLGSRGFQILLVLNWFWGSAGWCLGAWMPAYLRDHFQLSLAAAGISASAFQQAAAFAGVLLGGFLADRWSPHSPRSRTLLPAAGFLVACPFLLLTASTHSFPLAIPGLLLFGLARGIFDANHMPILRQIVDERLSATAYGFLNFQSCAAGGLLIYAGGLLNDARFGLGVVFQAVALSLLLLGALLLLLKPAPAHPAVPAPPQREPVLS